MDRPVFALGRLPVGHLNKTEKAYQDELERRRASGEVLWHRFEGIKLRLADNTFYTPDFAVMMADGEICLHEVKGGWFQDDAKVKIKVAASLYPFKFLVIRVRPKKDGGGWSEEQI